MWPESQLHANPTECRQHTVGAASSFLRVGGLLLRSAAVHRNGKGTRCSLAVCGLGSSPNSLHWWFPSLSQLSGLATGNLLVSGMQLGHG